MQACYFAGSCPACQKEAKNLDSQDLMDISKLAKIHIEKGYAIVGITGYFLWKCQIFFSKGDDLILESFSLSRSILQKKGQITILSIFSLGEYCWV